MILFELVKMLKEFREEDFLTIKLDINDNNIINNAKIIIPEIEKGYIWLKYRDLGISDNHNLPLYVDYYSEIVFTVTYNEDTGYYYLNNPVL